MNMQLPMLKLDYNLPFLVSSDSIPPKYLQFTAVLLYKWFIHEKNYIF